MAYRETTTTSWGELLKNAFKGIVTGFMLIVAACAALYWNEGRTIKTRDAINEAQSVYVEMADPSKIDPQFEGKLAHASGVAKTEDVVRDPVFEVSANTIKMHRAVEFYQWKENKHTRTEKKLGGGEETVTEYTYEKTWSSNPIASANFYSPSEHQNHVILEGIDDAYFVAPQVDFEAYRLPDFLINGISGYSEFEIKVNDETKAKLNKNVAQAKGVAAPSQSYVHTDRSGVFIGENPAVPQIGDIRVRFTALPASADVSIIAKVNGNTFEPYIARNEYKFSRLSMGRVSAESMFTSAQEENKVMAWMIRGLGIAMCILGFKLILKPISVFLGVVPLLGNIGAIGAGFVSFVLGLGLSLLVIAIAWFRFRPLLSAGLIAVIVALFLYFRKRKKDAPALPEEGNQEA